MASLQVDDDQLVKEKIKQAEAAPAAEDDQVIFDDEDKEEEPTEEVETDSKDVETEPIMEEAAPAACTGEEACKEAEFARDYFEVEEEEDKDEAEDSIKIDD